MAAERVGGVQRGWQVGRWAGGRPTSAPPAPPPVHHTSTHAHALLPHRRPQRGPQLFVNFDGILSCFSSSSPDSCFKLTPPAATHGSAQHLARPSLVPPGEVAQCRLSSRPSSTPSDTAFDKPTFERVTRHDNHNPQRRRLDIATRWPASQRRPRRGAQESQSLCARPIHRRGGIGRCC